MSQAPQDLHRIQDLLYDPQTREHYVALPCVTRSEAEGFRQLAPLFRFHRNAGSWITQQGYTAVPGITTRSAVIIVAHDLFEEVKTRFYAWLNDLLKAKQDAIANRKSRRANAHLIAAPAAP